MKDGTLQLLQKAHSALEAANRDIEAKAPDQAIARAYYATFHAATAILHEYGEYARTHTGIQHKFYETFIDSGRLDPNLSRILVALFQSRQEADYAFEAGFTLENARDAVQNAAYFVESIETHLSN